MIDNIQNTKREKVLEALDVALKKGPWDKTPFLSVIRKQLERIKDRFADETNPEKYISQEIKETVENTTPADADSQEIFISLYSSHGSDLALWEQALADIERYVISRPVYGNEKEVSAFIRSRPNPVNEAYAIARIRKTDVLTDLDVDKASADKLGGTLLHLKSRAVARNNIIRFVCFSGEYIYRKGILIKK